MRILVVYATKSGCTSGVAERVAASMRADDASVDVLSAEKAGSPDGYDVVVVGSGVRAGAWHRAAKSWVARHAGALKAMPVAFFTCGLAMSEGESKRDEVRGYTDALIAETGIEPVDIGLFAGWFVPKEFSLPERTILKMMKSPEGDFRDWQSIDRWAADTMRVLAEGLQKQQ